MNLTAAWAWRPDVFESFAALRSQLTTSSTLSKREQVLLVCAMASQLSDSYCALAWGKILAAEAGAEPAAAVLQGRTHPDLAARDLALTNWARKVDDEPNSTTEDDVASLRRARLATGTVCAARGQVCCHLRAGAGTTARC